MLADHLGVSRVSIGLLLLALVGRPFATPDVALPDPAARAAWDALLAPYLEASAMDVEFTGGVAGDDRFWDGRYRFARPLHGRATLDRDGHRTEAVADGAGLYLLRSDLQAYVRMPANLVYLPLVDRIAPLLAWTTGKAPEPLSLELVRPRPEHALLDVLRADFGDHVQELWIDSKRRLVAARSVQPLDTGGELEYVFTFDSVTLAKEVDPQEWGVSPPDDWDVLEDSAMGLLPVGLEVPDVVLTDLDGEEFVLSDLRGKTVVLDFWFYACAPCRTGLPLLNDLAAELRESRDDVVIVCVNPFDRADVVRRYWEKEGFDLRVGLSPDVADAFGVHDFPTTFVIDPEGTVVWRQGGDVLAELERRLEGR